MNKIIIFLCMFYSFGIYTIPEGWICTYLDERFTQHINKDEVHLILELGSLHGFDAISLSEYYHCPVYTFECDPVRLGSIVQNIADFPQVTLVPYGVWNESKEEVTFYHSFFHGASSFYNFNYEKIAEMNGVMSAEDLIKEQNLIMIPVKVKTIRLDEWIENNTIPSVDLLCVDVQGAAIKAFEGMGSYLKDVKYIITEIENKPIYEGETLADEVKVFLAEQGFECVIDVAGWWGDFLFVNKKYLK